jgi:hypothetical protein
VVVWPLPAALAAAGKPAAQGQLERWGSPALLLAWAPLIGDACASPPAGCACIGCPAACSWPSASSRATGWLPNRRCLDDARFDATRRRFILGSFPLLAQARFYQLWRAGRTNLGHASGAGRQAPLAVGRAFLHALNYCMVLPGPEAQQLATYIGWLMHRTWGGVVAGVLFVLPSFMFILLGGPLVESTHGQLKFTAPLKAITAAVVGVILNLALFCLSRPVAAGLCRSF